jgi:AcrR family transcriptional regulator
MAQLATSAPKLNGARRVSDMHRSRLLRAAVSTIDELGYPDASVARITERARMSRRTFYELFDNRDECFVAILDKTAGKISKQIETLVESELPWREHVRLGLWTILSFLEGEPALAKVCVVHALSGGPVVLERRAEILERLTEVIDRGRAQATLGQRCTYTTSEAVVGAAFAVVYGRLWRQNAPILTDAFPELLGQSLLPYLGATAVRREQERALPPTLLQTRPEAQLQQDVDPLRDVPMRLTYRTARVLECAAEHPGASNRQLGDYADIADQGQASKLLARLQRLQLLSNSSGGHLTGEPNRWTLTPKGIQVTQSIREHTSTLAR